MCAKHCHVEWQAHLVCHDQHRGFRPRGVTHADLIEHVGIGQRQVGHREVAQHEPLEHRLVDDAAHLLLVGPQRLHVRGLDCRRDHLFPHSVELDASSVHGLLAERHRDKAERLGCHDNMSPIVCGTNIIVLI
jgi:hypothetical protein